MAFLQLFSHIISKLKAPTKKKKKKKGPSKFFFCKHLSHVSKEIKKYKSLFGFHEFKASPCLDKFQFDLNYIVKHFTVSLSGKGDCASTPCVIDIKYITLL